MEGGVTGFGASTFFFGTGATGRGATGATAAAAPAGSGEEEVVAVVISFRPRKDFFLNMVQEIKLPVLPPPPPPPPPLLVVVSGIQSAFSFKVHNQYGTAASSTDIV